MTFLRTRASAALLSLAIVLSLCRASFAGTLTYTASPVRCTPVNPSSDSISLKTASSTVNPATGAFTFQTGDFVVGDSEIPDQDISFLLQDTVTLNGITQTLHMSGDDKVTRAVDTLTIASSLPVDFGGEWLTLQPFSLSETNLGDFPITLEASITPAPEPGPVLLLGTAAFFAGILGIKKASHPAITPSPGQP